MAGHNIPDPKMTVKTSEGCTIPLGNIVEYLPSTNELLVCMGIWAFGILLFSWMVHLAVPIMNGTFTKDTGVPRTSDVAIKGEAS